MYVNINLRDQFIDLLHESGVSYLNLMWVGDVDRRCIISYVTTWRGTRLLSPEGGGGFSCLPRRSQGRQLNPTPPSGDNRRVPRPGSAHNDFIISLRLFTIFFDVAAYCYFSIFWDKTNISQFFKL